MSNAKGIGQALGHFAMAFGHIAFGQKEESNDGQGTEGEETEGDDRAPEAGACCIKRGKTSKVRSVRRSGPR